ncbi:uncharacterized protein PFL1_04698 [Pseudozyma flocculosa PF-1]|uniref:Integral membrane protein n=2 Tax=Pseudozyma flocculosa TaxID=84751 RepID=A0A5C3F7P3_9BASI|nr:uncharacterized protein PFL1_04698 [Pseudozyma flocculosa PF-1]EPQ27560.1 hypothetical protein PFL1_04698 [Pseudozyma flocculosa PF-1]SPO39311.1 uncharacterized protein PSFLO_04792 [Pseudozyma flocculosa]
MTRTSPSASSRRVARAALTALFALTVVAITDAAVLSPAPIQPEQGLRQRGVATGPDRRPLQLLLPRTASANSLGVPLAKRHGDHEDDEEQQVHGAEPQQQQHGHDHDGLHADQHSAAAESMENEQPSSGHGDRPSTEESTNAKASDSHEHGHGHSHDHASASLPVGFVADADSSGDVLVPVPSLHIHGGHSHGGSGAPKEHLNETSLFLAKGPDPLSYIEWDFGYGAGSFGELQRFMASQDVLAGTPMMKPIDGRWRKLFDERDQEQRREIAADIASRIEGGQPPARHGGILALHVVLAVLGCFFMLPTALALRAAHSGLAPLASLVYLVTLGSSLLVSMLYKALTPRLYPHNSHGGLGWAIFWISLACLGSDVFRLVTQIWSKMRSLGGGSGSASSRSSRDGGPGGNFRAAGGRSWNDVVNTALGRVLPHSSEKYDALEEESMLAEAARSDDAREVDIEADLAARLRGHSRGHGSSGSGSPHRVHFDDGDYEEADWVGSGSTAVGGTSARPSGSRPSSPSNGANAALFDEPMTASPTTTVCNTPRNSVFGDSHLPGLGLKAVSSWMAKAEGASPLSASAARLPGSDKLGIAKPRRSRLQLLRNVLRYARVTVTRSLPVLAFAETYTGIAVYTGSCRSGYQNVCLAHGIKGGIFFWYGLFTFARYLGAYADCGWAWNKAPTSSRPSSPQGSSTGRRVGRGMPSAEFVECLVITIYGCTQIWNERQGAKPGDPWTIKQIQHTSIAGMFWFVGLLGLLLETGWVRRLLSLPIAYSHTAAIPLSEVRRRGKGGVRARGEGAGDDLDSLVDAQRQPASYSFSFNPFPALVIGVTGLAMSAHHQDYVYEVEIHQLWGNLLALFSVLRCLTYFLLWLRPPTASILPSRPPTEALGAFSLCCGGLVFMLSSEEVSFAAMRSGYGDFMAILNVVVAVVSLLFCWTTALMMIKGWAVRREVRRGLGEGQRMHGDMRGDDAEAGGVGLRLDTHVAAAAGPRSTPKRYRATVPASPMASAAAVEAGVTADGTTETVFVLDDDDDDDDDGGEGDDRHRRLGEAARTAR